MYGLKEQSRRTEYIEHPLSARDKARIRKVVREECANYDYEYGCLPKDAGCYMFCIGFRDSSLCRYFEECILPIHPELIEIFNRKPMNKKKCLICGKPFISLGNRKYCSDKCTAKARKIAGRKRVRRFRERSK